MNVEDFIALIHPAIAVVVLFPLIGIVVNLAWKTRQRRIQAATEGKSNISPLVGAEHVELGRWLSGLVVVLTLIGLAHPIIFNIILPNQLWNKQLFNLVSIVLMFAATIASLAFLYQAKQPLWRAIFATLTGVGLVVLGYIDKILGYQYGIYRREHEWYVSHFFLGIAAAFLMIFSLAIIQEIYKDRSNHWRNIHIILNCVALILFLGQGITGTRDLLEIPLSWQKDYVYKCDGANKTCPKPAPTAGQN